MTSPEKRLRDDLRDARPTKTAVLFRGLGGEGWTLVGRKGNWYPIYR